MKFLQTKPQGNSKKLNSFDLYYTVTSTLFEEEKNETSIKIISSLLS